MLLRRRRFGTVAYVAEERVKINEWRLRAIDVLGTRALQKDEMVPARPAGDINIFADLNFDPRSPEW